MKKEQDILTGKKIAIIDDDQFSVLLTKLKLKKHTDDKNITVFHQLDHAIDFFEGLKKEKTAMLPDIILLETMIDDARGWDFITHFEDISKHVSKSIKLVILTSSQFFSDYRRASTFKAVDGFLIKPLQVNLLTDLLDGSEHSKNAHQNMMLNSFIV